VYKKCDKNMVVFLVLYVDILLIRNDVGVLSLLRYSCPTNFDMKDLGEASYIFWIKFIQDRKKRMLGLSQATYIDAVLTHFSMHNSKMVTYLSDMGSLYLKISVPRNLKR